MIKLKRIISILIIAVLISIVGSVLINTYGPDILLLPYDKLFPLVLTVWQIQAVFASIIIAIGALALGVINQRIYGVNLLRYTFIEKEAFTLTLVDIIALAFLLTIANYPFIAYELLLVSW